MPGVEQRPANDRNPERWCRTPPSESKGKRQDLVTFTRGAALVHRTGAGGVLLAAWPESAEALRQPSRWPGREPEGATPFPPEHAGGQAMDGVISSSA
jgi:hypothetical protein